MTFEPIPKQIKEGQQTIGSVDRVAFRDRFVQLVRDKAEKLINTRGEVMEPRSRGWVNEDDSSIRLARVKMLVDGYLPGESAVVGGNYEHAQIMENLISKEKFGKNTNASEYFEGLINLAIAIAETENPGIDRLVDRFAKADFFLPGTFSIIGAAIDAANNARLFQNKHEYAKYKKDLAIALDIFAIFGVDLEGHYFDYKNIINTKFDRDGLLGLRAEALVTVERIIDNSNFSFENIQHSNILLPISSDVASIGRLEFADIAVRINRGLLRGQFYKRNSGRRVCLPLPGGNYVYGDILDVMEAGHNSDLTALMGIRANIDALNSRIPSGVRFVKMEEVNSLVAWGLRPFVEPGIIRKFREELVSDMRSGAFGVSRRGFQVKLSDVTDYTELGFERLTVKRFSDSALLDVEFKVFDTLIKGVLGPGGELFMPMGLSVDTVEILEQVVLSVVTEYRNKKFGPAKIDTGKEGGELPPTQSHYVGPHLKVLPAGNIPRVQTDRDRSEILLTHEYSLSEINKWFVLCQMDEGKIAELEAIGDTAFASLIKKSLNALAKKNENYESQRDLEYLPSRQLLTIGARALSPILRDPNAQSVSLDARDRIKLQLGELGLSTEDLDLLTQLMESNNNFIPFLIAYSAETQSKVLPEPYKLRGAKESLRRILTIGRRIE